MFIKKEGLLRGSAAAAAAIGALGAKTGGCAGGGVQPTAAACSGKREGAAEEKAGSITAGDSGGLMALLAAAAGLAAELLTPLLLRSRHLVPAVDFSQRRAAAEWQRAGGRRGRASGGALGCRLRCCGSAAPPPLLGVAADRLRLRLRFAVLGVAAGADATRSCSSVLQALTTLLGALP